MVGALDVDGDGLVDEVEINVSNPFTQSNLSHCVESKILLLRFIVLDATIIVVLPYHHFISFRSVSHAYVAVASQ